MTQDNNVPTGEVYISQLDLEVSQITKNEEINSSEITLSKPDFPLEIFPKIIQEIVHAANLTLNYPVEFTASSMLFATSIAVGNTHKVRIKNGFEQSGVIYLCLVAPSGSAKSHPLEFAIKPIINADIKSFTFYKEKMLKYYKDKELAKTDEKVEVSKKPVWVKSLVTDYTPEALYTIHSNNLRSIGVYADEIAGWFKNFERYSNGSQQEFWLSSWSGKLIGNDRKSSEPCLIPNPFIPVAGTIQPSLLKEITKENRSKNGFIARMLFVYLQNLQKKGWHDEEMPQDLIDRYHHIITCLLNLPCNLDENGQIKSTMLKFSEKAKENLYTWVNQINTPLINQTDNEEFKGIFAKLEQYVPRFALLLHLLEWASEGITDYPTLSISVETVNGAIKLAEYFRFSATEVSNVLNNQVEDLMCDNRKEWYSILPDVFTTKTAIDLGEKVDFAKRSVNRMLAKDSIFKKLSHGKYEKIY
jgi:hypothetical protein